jgi:hypothetical protein
MSHSDANDTVVDTVSPDCRSGAWTASAAAASSRSFSVTVAVEGFARARQRQRPVLAFEKGHAERVLQRLHLPRQRRLRHEQLFRRQREREPAPAASNPRRKSRDGSRRRTLCIPVDHARHAD